MAPEPAPRKLRVPLGVWAKTALIVAVTMAVTTAYDVYYRYNNPYIRAVEQRIARFERHPGKPLVVAIGASLMMLGTPRDWPRDDFDWLRLIIQGSRLEDFAAVTDEIVALDPDLVVIDLHQFVDKPYGVRLRRAFKRLMRAPLEAAGWIRRATTHFEGDACGRGLEFAQALDHVKEEFGSPTNTILSSSMLDSFESKGIPVAIVRVPMFAGIESKAGDRNEWMENAQRAAGTRGLKIHDPGWRDLGERYFCPDKTHMSDAGEKVFSRWLAPEISAALDSLQ